jgi:hypothetical protein
MLCRKMDEFLLFVPLISIFYSEKNATLTIVAFIDIVPIFFSFDKVGSVFHRKVNPSFLGNLFHVLLSCVYLVVTSVNYKIQTINHEFC